MVSVSSARPQQPWPMCPPPRLLPLAALVRNAKPEHLLPLRGMRLGIGEPFSCGYAENGNARRAIIAMPRYLDRAGSTDMPLTQRQDRISSTTIVHLETRTITISIGSLYTECEFEIA